jgi:hypothetical protein
MWKKGLVCVIPPEIWTDSPNIRLGSRVLSVLSAALIGIFISIISGYHFRAHRRRFYGTGHTAVQQHDHRGRGKNKRFLKKRPAYILPFRIAARIKKSAAVREAFARDEGLVVSPVLILSVTNDCNLACAGCYACSHQRDRSAELSMEDIRCVVGEAVALGVCVVMIAGGEPLLKPEILSLPPAHPDTLFVMFTNGLLLGSPAAQAAARMRNLIPIISQEGGRALTDERRGEGVYDAATAVMRRLDGAKRMFGVSVTLTSRNYDDVIRGDYLMSMQALGCRAAFLIEYVPCSAEDEALCLTPAQKTHLRQIEKQLYRQYNMLVVPLPGNVDRRLPRLGSRFPAHQLHRRIGALPLRALVRRQRKK